MEHKLSLQAKVILLLSVLIASTLTVVVYSNITAEATAVKHEVQVSSHVVADTVLAGILYPMAQGDGDAVRKEMVSMKKSLEGGALFVFGRTRIATYASEKSKEGVDLSKEITSPALAAAVQTMIATGKAPEQAFEEQVAGKTYLSLVRPILNEAGCKTCHEGNEAVHGGLLVRQNIDGMYASLRQQMYRNIAIGLVCCVLILGVTYLTIARLVTRPIHGIVNRLTSDAEQLQQASSQVAASSQTVADGASAQAAGLEQTAASLAQLSSQTTTNADSASQVDRLLQEARGAVTHATTDMNRLSESMEDIARASAETSKIIRTIDEIAFQTNLLALNASVEAARAGTAGAGFAVVASEVRNLSVRAAQAAKSTSEMLEQTVAKVKAGSALVAKASGDLADVATHTVKACDCAAAIVKASREQAQGIGEISSAVSDMDQVVQANAAGAEESAGSAKELSQLADGVQHIVTDLVLLVDGQGESGGTTGTAVATVP